jgi:5'-phosphate synthase pdxT subunit
LALQGAVREHLEALRRLGVEAITVRTPEEVEASEALILPGGESTTIGKLMVRYGLQEPIRQFAAAGRPLLGTCAGMILMAKLIEGGIQDQPSLGVMDITVARNAFGRQVDSFEADLEFAGVEGGPARAVFIRAPIIAAVGSEVEVLARHEGRIVAARQGNLLALSFHPELTDDTRVHAYFLSLRG